MKTLNIKKLILLFAVFFLYQYCSTENSTKTNEIILKNSDYIKSFPHGMMEVSFTIIDIIEEENKIILNSKIDTVHRYGAGVKPIAEGTTHLIEIDSDLFNSNKSYFNSGNSIKGSLSSLPNGMEISRASKLKFIKIIKARK